MTAKETAVAPLAGAWIEMIMFSGQAGAGKVAPLAGAWIEITKCGDGAYQIRVAPLAGAWIEIKKVRKARFTTLSRSPCGSVD